MDMYHEDWLGLRLAPQAYRGISDQVPNTVHFILWVIMWGANSPLKGVVGVAISECEPNRKMHLHCLSIYI